MVCSQWKLSGDGVREDRCASRSAEVEALSTAGWPHGAERASDVAGRLGDENPAVLSLVEF